MLNRFSCNMPSITTLLALAAIVALTTAAPAPILEERQTLPAGANGSPYLIQAAIAKGKVYFGTAVAIPGSETSDSEYLIFASTNYDTPSMTFQLLSTSQTAELEDNLPRSVQI